jgi:cytoplasmic tRNA 2-thiolation protein 2
MVILNKNKRECFQEYFTHKFRATIGKNKILEKDEIVLFPYSASSSSVAMLHLISKVDLIYLNYY